MPGLDILGIIVFGLCIFVVVVLVTISYLRLSNFNIFRTQQSLHKTQHQNSEPLDALKSNSYPKHLVTKADVALYLSSNSGLINYEKDFPMIEMLQRMSKAGWHTEIVFYSKYRYGAYEFHLNCEDSDLQAKLYKIIHNYEENYDVKKLSQT